MACHLPPLCCRWPPAAGVCSPPPLSHLDSLLARHQGPETFDELFEECLPHIAAALRAAASRPASSAASSHAEDDEAEDSKDLVDGSEHDATEAFVIEEEESDDEVDVEAEKAHQAWRQSLATLQQPRYKVSSPPPDEPELEENEADVFFEHPCAYEEVL